MNKAKTVEQIYQKKTPLEHILLRPDSYVGNIELMKAQMWIVNETNCLQKTEFQYVPALFKIFDQVLVNAADNYRRDTSMNLLKVTLNSKQGFIEVYNNGQGIPVQIHKDQKIYVPQLIFGHLLTGSSYDDEQKKLVGGRNGYGAKLTNIFSTKFIVEAADGKSQKKFLMTWQKNMSQHSPQQISSYSGKDFTRIRFYPDLKLFKLKELDIFTVGLFKKRVYDMAGVLGGKVKVYFNQDLIKIKNFQDYVKLYLHQDAPRFYDREANSERWQVIVSLSEDEFNQVSFVNSICTSKGGNHVNYITEHLVSAIIEAIPKKNKDLTVKPANIKQHLWIFVNSLIQNPSFDSQTKQTLTTKVSQFGSLPQISQKLVKNLLKSGILQQIINEAKVRQLNKMSKATAGGKKGKVSGIPKLQDANQAGSRNSQKCTLILTQGDSAKGLAMSGIQVVGRDFYGVFPLKGKLLNVRQASNKQIMENQEIQNLIRIMGLQIGKNYQDVKGLRYGSIMIMTDQDTDGSHIKGLILNFIHHFWPSLIKYFGFMKQFITPILKAIKGSQVKSFYSIQQYKFWSERNQTRGWRIKYYKGLGTSTDKQAQEYFSALEQNRLTFEYGDIDDDQALDLVFNKKKADDRKRWLESYNPNKNIDYTNKKLRYKTFINEQFIHFSIADNMRSIPSLCDGLKPGQRKILFACFKRNLKQQIKVAQLSGYVSEHSAYHHGQMSLAETIVGMAQDFVGSNNVNLLQPIGQFGSRNQGGKQHASARYIFTNLSKTTRYLFPQSDDHSLNYLQDDGQLVQPSWYIPVLPLALINGAQGIGTGWSTSIPCYNPRDLACWIKLKLQGKTMEEQIKPWYKGFQGKIQKDGSKKFTCDGLYQLKNQNTTVAITQLPIKKWTKDFKLFLDKLVEDQDGYLQDVRQYHTKNRVHFEVDLADGVAQKWGTALPKNLKLFGSISMTNLVLFDKDCKLKKYNGPEQILQEYYQIRLEFYKKRKDYLMSKLDRQLQILENKRRFIVEVIKEILVIRNVKKKAICQQLLKRGYTKFSDILKIKSTKKHKTVTKEQQKEEQGQQKEENVSVVELTAKEYDYLLRMPLWSLTFEQVEKIEKQSLDKKKQKANLQSTKIETMWINDIDKFLEVMQEVEQEEEKQRLKALGKVKGGTKQTKKRQPKKTKVKESAKEKEKQESDKESKDTKSRKKGKRNNSKNSQGSGTDISEISSQKAKQQNHSSSSQEHKSPGYKIDEMQQFIQQLKREKRQPGFEMDSKRKQDQDYQPSSKGSGSHQRKGKSRKILRLSDD